MLLVVLRLDGCLAAVRRASLIVDSQVEDDILCGGEFKYFAGDSLEVVEEGTPVSG